MFSLLPAIDLTRGRLGEYTPEGPRAVEDLAGDPLEAAATFTRLGARWLHVVDMDLAFTGEATGAGVMTSIHGAHPDVNLQCSGGVRDREAIDHMLAAGASRVVIGSSALASEQELAVILGDLGDRVVVSIEVEDGRIRSRGRDGVDVDLMSSVGWLTAAGARGFVVTALARVGSRQGPDVGVVKRVARSGVPTLAAGGIGSLADLEAVRDAGATGAVVGRAALDGSLDLRAAFAWAGSH